MKDIRMLLKYIKFSPSNSKAEGMLHSIPKDKVPFATIHVDYVTKKDECRLRVIVDAFTKFI